MVSGRAITNARIKQRKPDISDCRWILSTGGSCKHLCCHEGVDRPPKAPRNSLHASCPQSESKVDSKQKNVQAKLQMEKHALGKETKNVETVDLAHTRTSDDYAKVAPRAYRSLHQLHKKINKNSQTPVVANTKPSFSYKKGNQPTLTFLSRPGSSGKRNEDPSSEYGAGWMDDLPSPSALLQADDETDTCRKPIDAAHHELLPQASDCASEHSGFSSTGDSEKQPTNQSAGNPKDTAVFTNDQYDEAIGNLGSDAGREVSHYFTDSPSNYGVKGTDGQKLFMSTDSPDKPSSPPAKRKFSESFGNEFGGAGSVHKARKREQLDPTNDAHILQPSPNKENHASAPAIPTIKPGYPDWVYDFDPAFVAEWEPYVEFV